MSSLETQQAAMVKTAEQTELLVKAISELNRQLELQHKDNAKTQETMKWATIVMAVAAIIALFG